MKTTSTNSEKRKKEPESTIKKFVNPKGTDFPTVGIGASAGGLEVLGQFF